MRKLVLLAAAVPLLFAPTAVAAERKPELQSVCRVPEVELSYDTEIFTALVSLPVSGCQSRENRIFSLSASISRWDPEGGRDMTERFVHCGPFRPADDVEPGKKPPGSSCDLGLFLPHPQMETARYDVDVTYPAAGAQQTMRLFTSCTSDGKTASCEE